MSGMINNGAACMVSLPMASPTSVYAPIQTYALLM